MMGEYFAAIQQFLILIWYFLTDKPAVEALTAEQPPDTQTLRLRRRGSEVRNGLVNNNRKRREERRVYVWEGTCLRPPCLVSPQRIPACRRHH